jgi:hypothetical protein
MLCGKHIFYNTFFSWTFIENPECAKHIFYNTLFSRTFIENPESYNKDRWELCYI